MKKSWITRIRRLQLLIMNIYIYISSSPKRIIRLPAAVLRRIWRKIHPTREREEYTAFLEYRRTFQWEKAYHTGRAIIDEQNIDVSVLYPLARCSYEMGKTNEAVELMEQYLSLKYGLTRIQVIEKVQSVFAETYDIESCEYHFLGGALNCGFIETVVLDPYSKKSKTLLTKLVEGEQNRDETFYRVVYPLVETLHPMIPKLINLRTLQGLTLLTTEKAEGRTPSEEDFKTVLEANRAIEAIPFERTMAIFNALDINVQERFFVTRRSLLHSYWNIYLTLASKTDDPERIYAVFTRQYRMLRDIKIHHLAIDANYSFCHGDFHKDNILVQNGTVIILDWTHYKLAPLGNDVEYYFHIYQDHFPDFSEIRQQYLDQRFPLHGDARQNAVSILLFIHQVTRSRVIRLKHGELEADYERFFLPAVEYAIDIASRYLGYRTPGR